MQAYAPLNIPDLNWALTAQVAASEVLEPLEQLKRRTLIVACLLTLLTTLLSMLMARRILRPIEALVHGIDDIKSGKTSVRIVPESNDENGKLTQSFNNMTAVIDDRDRTIHAKNDAYATLFNRIFPHMIADRMRLVIAKRFIPARMRCDDFRCHGGAGYTQRDARWCRRGRPQCRL